jgi:hypothetical protein
MADVSSTLAAWSSTTASNAPAGSTTIGTGLDDNLREIQGVIVRGLSHKGSDIASVAGTTDIGAVEGLMHDITGAETITGLGTVRAGILKVLKFEGAATLTHNATSLILPGGANIVCAVGDIGFFISEGSGNWRCVSFTKAAGGVLGPVVGTVQATTSGTAFDFTIPVWAKRVSVHFRGVSLSGTDDILVQIGTGGAATTSGYVSTSTAADHTGGTSGASSTAGFIVNLASAAIVLSGSMTINLIDAATNAWVASHAGKHTTTQTVHGGGDGALAGALNFLRVTRTGTDTFDAGAVNVMYE